MPSAAMRTCLEPRCPVLVLRGRCPVHRQIRERERPNLVARKLYHTARWKALKDQKRLDNPLCVDCQADGRTEPWTALDHIVPHRGDLDLFWDYSNLQGLCDAHHSAKTRRGE